MTKPINHDIPEIAEHAAQLARVVAHITAAAQPGVVYSAPITVGAYTIITASQIRVGSGFGSGFRRADRPMGPDLADGRPGQNADGGMGGGGGSVGRPVAIIVIGPEGVTVKPVIDVTKLALAGMAILGTLIVVLRRLLRP